jgi:hypothetical protein
VGAAGGVPCRAERRPLLGRDRHGEFAGRYVTKWETAAASYRYQLRGFLDSHVEQIKAMPLPGEGPRITLPTLADKQARERAQAEAEAEERRLGDIALGVISRMNDHHRRPKFQANESRQRLPLGITYEMYA